MGSGIQSQQKGYGNFHRLFPINIQRVKYLHGKCQPNAKEKKKRQIIYAYRNVLEEGESRAPSVTRMRDTRSRTEVSRKLSLYIAHTLFRTAATCQIQDKDTRMVIAEMPSWASSSLSRKTLFPETPCLKRSHPCVSYIYHDLTMSV